MASPQRLRELRIAVDARALLEPPGGLRRYTEELLAALAKAEPDARFELVAPRSPGSRATLGPASSEHVVPGSTRTVLRPLWEARGLPRFLAARRPDALLSPYGAVPAGGACPVVATLHDLAFLKDPRHIARRHAPYWRRVARRLPRAAAVLCVSEAVRQDAIALLEVPAERLWLAPSAAAPRFAPAPPDAVTRARRELSLDGPFVLVVASWEPRKNLEMLAAAMAGLDIPLAVVGRPDRHCARRYPHVRQLGRLDDAQLAAVMTAATIVAVPSLDEGFGLPVIEAMACGAPVVASHAGAIPEVAAGAALLLPPTDPAAWRTAVTELAADPARRRTLIEQGRQRAGELTWEASARRTWAAIHAVVSHL